MTGSCLSQSSDGCARPALGVCCASRPLLTHQLLPWGTLGPSFSCLGAWGLSLISVVSNQIYPVPLSSWGLSGEVLSKPLIM